MSKTRKGRQEPTVWVTQPYEKSLYKDCIELYEQSGRKAQEWQKNIMKDILAINKDELWIHTRYGYSVPRRNGKNECVAMRELYGLFKGQTGLHTAHRVNTSSEAARRLATILREMGYKEVQREKSDEIYSKSFKYMKQVGQEKIILLDEGGGSVSFRTRTDNGGLGEGFDYLIIDEAQEYTNSQETSLKYVVSASKNPQIILCGTPPTAVSGGTVFQSFRNRQIKETQKNAGWAEWSVAEMTDPHDIESWYESNPSLGTTLTERTVEDEIGDDDIDFNIQRLGLWIIYNQASAIKQRDWKKTEAPFRPSMEGKLFVGIKYGNNGMNTAVSVACRTTDGKIFISVYDIRSRLEGDEWICDFLANTPAVEMIIVDGKVGVKPLTDMMKEYRLKKPVLVSSIDFLMASSSFEQAVFNNTIWHLPQPALDDIATNCEKKPYGSSGGFVYKSLVSNMDICLLDSVILAHWACASYKPPKVQRVQY